MRKLILASIALLAAPLAAQDSPQPPAPVQCAKVSPVTTSTDIPALQADADCFGKVEKAWDAVADNARAKQASARQSRKYREKRIAAVKKLPPEPTTPKLVAVGDSITHWGGDYSDKFAEAHPTLAYEKIAVGGATLGLPADRGTTKKSLWAQIDQVIAAKPTVVTVFIGANGLLQWFNTDDDVSDWTGSLFAYTDALRQATGAKIIVGTVMPRCVNSWNNPAQATLFEARRINANEAIRDEIGKSIDGVIDFGADPALADPCDKSIFIDGLHPTDGTHPGDGNPTGQQIMAADAAPVLNAVLAGKDAPKPTPVPTPTQTEPVATVQEHGFPEFAKVAPNYDRASLLVSAWGNGAIPPSNAGDVVGAFRLICAPSHLSYDDPVVYPGEAGKSHLHLFFGNTKADASSTYASLRTSGDSTCGALNRSAYWMPALVNSDKVILPDYAMVYYKRRPASDPDCAVGSFMSPKGCIGLPRGLRYIFGHTIDGGFYGVAPSSSVNFTCSGKGVNLSNHDYATVAKDCPVGSTFVVQMAAPQCWNGKDLDSADHRAHVSYMVRDRNSGQPGCPAAFPYQIPDFHFNVSWTMREEMRNAKFSSDIQMGKAAGETVHADWFGAWDDETLAAWLTNCIDGFKNASGGDLCNGQQIKGASQPSYGFHNPNPVVDVPAVGATVALN